MGLASALKGIERPEDFREMHDAYKETLGFVQDLLVKSLNLDPQDEDVEMALGLCNTALFEVIAKCEGRKNETE